MEAVGEEPPVTIDRDKLQMAREGRASRLERGVTDERADVCLALYEAGISGWEPGVPTETLKAWLADPSSAQTRVLPQIPTTGDDGVPKVRRGGEPASNQFGTFEVHNASPKQIAFAKRLLEQKDLTGIKVPKDIDSISKTAASALIDRLLGRPDRATSVGTPSGSVRLASDKQLAYLRNLIEQRDYFSLVPADRTKVDAVKAGKVPTAKGASELIEVLRTTVYADRPTAGAAELEAGIYRHPESGDILKVYRAVHGSGQMCAKRLVVFAESDRYTKVVRGKEVEIRADFEYLGLATRFVQGHQRMTLEQAKQYGAIYGVCVSCGATLTDEKSIERAMGPVCAGRFK